MGQYNRAVHGVADFALRLPGYTASSFLTPPSTGLVICAILTEEAIARLFMAGILPSLLMALLFITAFRIVTLRNPLANPPGDPRPLAERLRLFARATPLIGVILGLGFDPIWFGVIAVIAIGMGMITPPVGLNVFVVRGVAGDVPLVTIFAGVLPFLVAMIVTLRLVILIPGIALLIQNSMFGQFERSLAMVRGAI